MEGFVGASSRCGKGIQPRRLELVNGPGASQVAIVVKWLGLIALQIPELSKGPWEIAEVHMKRARALAAGIRD